MLDIPYGDRREEVTICVFSPRLFLRRYYIFLHIWGGQDKYGTHHDFWLAGGRGGVETVRTEKVKGEGFRSYTSYVNNYVCIYR